MDCGAGWRSERRGRLLEAAGRVFARAGYDAASMDDIAAEAGIGKPTIYRYFDGKAALFTAVFAETLDALDEKLRDILDRDGSVEERLHGMVLALVPTFRDHLVSLRILSEDAAAIDRSNRLLFREHRARIAGRLAEALDGPGTRADPLNTAHLVIGMIWSATAALTEPDEAVAARITRLVLHGIGDACADEGRRPTRFDTTSRTAECRRETERLP